MTSDEVQLIRSALLEAYAAAVQRVEGERVTRRWLEEHPGQGAVAVIALGKAAGAMALGAQLALGERLLCGLVVTKPGHADRQALDLQRFRLCEGAHPLPDASSLAAGQALLDFIAALPAQLPVLVLVSGGASALVEVLKPGVSLDTLARASDWLLANGRPIAQINAVRRRLSALKGGGLAGLLGGREVTALLISDVEGDDPAVIGSGPLTPPTDLSLPQGLPDWLLELLPPGPTGPASALAQANVILVATLDNALMAAEASLRAQGLKVRRHQAHLNDDIGQAVETVVQTAARSRGEIQLWGGEVTVVLPSQPGRGGRNQQLALQLAAALAGTRPATALCAGTDGTDGPTEDAGGLVDNQTIERGSIEGLSAAESLRRADAGSYLECSGDLICTGPTGTNVTDLVMVWCA